jgi:hypothetical protein
MMMMMMMRPNQFQYLLYRVATDRTAEFLGTGFEWAGELNMLCNVVNCATVLFSLRAIMCDSNLYKRNPNNGLVCSITSISLNGK